MTDLAEIPARHGVRNVYGDLGQIFAQSTVAEPRLCAAMMGQLVKGLGADHVVWGTDAIWTGAPQWQIEALRRWVDAQPCEFPESPHHPGSFHGGGDHHHEPKTGPNGVQLDALMVACCRRAHDLCDASPAHGGWTEEQKQAAAHRTWTRFWRMASAAVKRAVARELLAAVE